MENIASMFKNECLEVQGYYNLVSLIPLMENINWQLNKIELMKENLHGFIKGKSFLIIPNEQFDEIL